MEIALKIIFVSQCIASGFFVGDQLKWQRTKVEKLKCLILAFLILTVGVLAIPIALVIIVFGFIWRQINRLHVGFIVKYIILKKPFYNFNKKAFLSAQARANKLSPGWWQFEDRIYRYCVNWIKNNYYDSGRTGNNN